MQDKATSKLFSDTLIRLEDVNESLYGVGNDCAHFIQDTEKAITKLHNDLSHLDDSLPTDRTSESREKRMFFTRNEAVLANVKKIETALAVFKLSLGNLGEINEDDEGDSDMGGGTSANTKKDPPILLTNTGADRGMYPPGGANVALNGAFNYQGKRYNPG